MMKRWDIIRSIREKEENQIKIVNRKKLFNKAWNIYFHMSKVLQIIHQAYDIQKKHVEFERNKYLSIIRIYIFIRRFRNKFPDSLPKRLNNSVKWSFNFGVNVMNEIKNESACKIVKHFLEDCRNRSDIENKFCSFIDRIIQTQRKIRFIFQSKQIQKKHVNDMINQEINHMSNNPKKGKTSQKQLKRYKKMVDDFKGTK